MKLSPISLEGRGAVRHTSHAVRSVSAASSSLKSRFDFATVRPSGQMLYGKKVVDQKSRVQKVSAGNYEGKSDVPAKDYGAEVSPAPGGDAKEAQQTEVEGTRRSFKPEKGKSAAWDDALSGIEEANRAVMQLTDIVGSFDEAVGNTLDSADGQSGENKQRSDYGKALDSVNKQHVGPADEAHKAVVEPGAKGSFPGDSADRSLRENVAGKDIDG